jgi:cytochrome P450
VVAVQRDLDAVLRAEIAERRRDPGPTTRSDVLSRLLRVGSGASGDQPLSDAELRDQLVTLLLAGHETTASALAWALLELARDESLARRAREAADGSPAEGSAFLEAVVKESLRLHPVIPMVVRLLAAPATVDGRRLPAGVSVAPSVLLTHTDDRWFPDPQAFRPDRFLTGEVDPGSWLPFGGGVRRCLGAGFSLMEGVAVLREVLRSHDVRVAPGRPEGPRVRNITSVPARGARLVVTRRSRS